jgi:hypothetical protein
MDRFFIIINSQLSILNFLISEDDFAKAAGAMKAIHLHLGPLKTHW